MPAVTADPSDGSQAPDSSPRRWSRRRILAFGVGGVAVVLAGGALGLELVSHGVLPGQQELDRVDGACSVAGPAFRFSGRGSSKSGTFSSRARRRQVGYTVAWPPGHGPGSTLPLVVMLHGEGGNHSDALSGLRPEQAVALEVGGQPLPPMGLVTVDGGSGYWNPHPDDDPMAMVVDELIPMCQALGLGRGHRNIGTMGISMGGYGALLLAEKYPELIGAVAAISPAIWTSYAEAQAVNSGAYASAAAFSDERCRDACRRAWGDARSGRVRLRRSVPPGSRRLVPRAPILGRRVLAGLSHGRLLHCRGAPVTPVPGAAPRLTPCCRPRRSTEPATESNRRSQGQPPPAAKHRRKVCAMRAESWRANPIEGISDCSFRPGAG